MCHLSAASLTPGANRRTRVSFVREQQKAERSRQFWGPGERRAITRQSLFITLFGLKKEEEEGERDIIIAAAAEKKPHGVIMFVGENRRD